MVAEAARHELQSTVERLQGEVVTLGAELVQQQALGLAASDSLAAAAEAAAAEAAAAREAELEGLRREAEALLVSSATERDAAGTALLEARGELEARSGELEARSAELEVRCAELDLVRSRSAELEARCAELEVRSEEVDDDAVTLTLTP